MHTPTCGPLSAGPGLSSSSAAGWAGPGCGCCRWAGSWRPPGPALSWTRPPAACRPPPASAPPSQSAAAAPRPVRDKQARRTSRNHDVEPCFALVQMTKWSFQGLFALREACDYCCCSIFCQNSVINLHPRSKHPRKIANCFQFFLTAVLKWIYLWCHAESVACFSRLIHNTPCLPPPHPPPPPSTPTHPLSETDYCAVTRHRGVKWVV